MMLEDRMYALTEMIHQTVRGLSRARSPVLVAYLEKRIHTLEAELLALEQEALASGGQRAESGLPECARAGAAPVRPGAPDGRG